MKQIGIYLLLTLNLLVTGFLTYQHFQSRNHPPDLSTDIIKVRGLIVVDSLGVERVILGSPLPDPQFHGYRIPRGEDAGVSGIMLYDGEGQERGGYVTDDYYGNVFLTFDSKTEQQALLIAEPQGGATTMLWARNGNKITLGAYDEEVSVDIQENGKNVNIKPNEK